MFKTILAASDGSDHATKAVEFASDLARTSGASLDIVHVVTFGELPEGLRDFARVEYEVESSRPTSPSAMDMVPGTLLVENEGGATEVQRLREIAGQKIVDRAAQIAKSKGVREVRTIVERGDPSRAIIACAEREHADLIVMGTRGLGALKGLLLGSNSHKVCQLAPCTCVTVK